MSIRSAISLAISAGLYCIGQLRAAETTWFVSPSGNDAAEGSRALPFATVQRAQDAAHPGDTIYLRGGTYRMTDAQISARVGIFARLTVLDKSGDPGKPITYRAYQDEQPVFDCSGVQPPGLRVSAFYVSGSWLRLIGLDVTGVQVTMPGHTQSICFESQGSHNIFERLRMHDGQAIGIYHLRGSDNLFLNCDAWNNWDYTSDGGQGGNVDGFGCHPPMGSTGNVFRGCRAWFNSDDGFDCIGAYEPVIFEKCWALYNGLSSDGRRLGDGNGFKAGGYGSTRADRLPVFIPRHIVRSCLSVGNKNYGFYANHHPGGCDWLDNRASRNRIDFNMLGRLADNKTDVDGSGHKLANNLSYASREGAVANLDVPHSSLLNNSFPPGAKFSREDFVSLDEGELLLPRQADGSLPATNFLRRTPASDRAGADLSTRSKAVRKIDEPPAS